MPCSTSRPRDCTSPRATASTARRRALRQPYARVAPELIEPPQKLRPRKNRRRRNGWIAFRARHLHQLHLPSAFEERALDQRFVAELVGDRRRRFRHALEHVLDRARVRPCQQAVDVSELLPEFVVARRHDRDDFVWSDIADCAASADARASVRFLLSCTPSVCEHPPRRLVERHRGDHERAEVVALATLVAADPAPASGSTGSMPSGALRLPPTADGAASSTAAIASASAASGRSKTILQPPPFDG